MKKKIKDKVNAQVAEIGESILNHIADHFANSDGSIIQCGIADALNKLSEIVRQEGGRPIVPPIIGCKTVEEISRQVRYHLNPMHESMVLLIDSDRYPDVGTIYGQPSECAKLAASAYLSAMTK